MSQTPNPHDPYGTEPSASVPPQTPAPHEDAPSGDMPAPTSDPALHPHDPFALDPSDPQQPAPDQAGPAPQRSEEHTSELQSRGHLVCRLLLEKKKRNKRTDVICLD